MKITLQAGEDKTLSLEGYGFYVVAADGPIIAELREIDGRIDQSGALMPGQGLQGRNRFESVRIINMHTAAQTIEIYTGSRTFIDNRNVGVVQVSGVVSVEQVNDDFGTRFSANRNVNTASTKYGWWELQNPIGSGVDLYVHEVSISKSVAPRVNCQKANWFSVAAATAYASKSIDDMNAVTAANVTMVTNAVSNYTLDANADTRVAVMASSIVGEVVRKFDRLVRVGEGEALAFFTDGASTIFEGGVIWEERPNV